MEGNLFVLFIAVVLSIATVIAVIIGVLKGFVLTDSPAPSRSLSKASSSFVREDIVSGYLLVDGRKVPTYNMGHLSLDDGIITLRFYKGINAPVRITDITMNGKSVYSLLAPHTSEKERRDYTIQVLKRTANQGFITHDLASEVEQIIIDVECLNAHIKAGEIVTVPGTEDYAWRG